MFIYAKFTKHVFWKATVKKNIVELSEQRLKILFKIRMLFNTYNMWGNSGAILTRKKCNHHKILDIAANNISRFL